MEDDAKKPTKRNLELQQELKSLEKIEPTGESDVPAIAEEPDVDVENVLSNANLITETKLDEKAKKRNKPIKGQTLKTEAKVQSDETSEKKMTASQATKQEQVLEIEAKDTNQSVETTEEVADPAKPPEQLKINKNKKNEGVEKLKPSSAGDVSLAKKETAIDQDSEMVLPKGKAKKRKLNERVQMPETSSSGAVSSDDAFEVKSKIKKTSQTKGNPKSKALPKEEEKAPKPLNRSILQLKITLRDVTPPIWRRIHVLNNDKFYNLHNYIKEAMGWMSPAGHQFVAADPKKKSNLLVVDASLEGVMYDFTERHLLKGQTTRLSKFLNAKNDHILYEFDFGESWMHDIIVEKVLPPPPPKAQYPKCTGGQRASPPAECGGVDGYMHLMEVYKDPKHSEYEELIVDWLGDQAPGWNPEKFDKKKIFNKKKISKRVKMWVYVGP